MEAAPSCSADDHTHAAVRPLPEEAALDQAARLWRALADQERLRLLFRLSRGEACVTELAVAEEETLATISQRLRVLRSENLVVRQRRGKHINYALADQHVAALLSTVMTHTRGPKHD